MQKEASELGNKLLEIAKELVRSGSMPPIDQSTPVAKAQGTPAVATGSRWAEEIEKEEGMKQPEPPGEEMRKPRKWVDVLTGNRERANGWVLTYSPPLVNTTMVTITPEESEEACANWRNALVGFVVGMKPGFRQMEGYANARWRGDDKPKVHLLQEGIFMFDFSTEEAKEKVLDQNWSFWGRPLILKPWTPNMDLKNMDVETVPVWVQFPQLPLSCWSPRILGKIASAIGVPLATDQQTAQKGRLAYARVLVEMKLKNQLLYQVPVSDNGRDFLQEVRYEWLPLRCSKCRAIGHDNFNCRLPEKKIWVEKPAAAPAEEGEETIQEESSESGERREEVVVNVEEVVLPVETVVAPTQATQTKKNPTKINETKSQKQVRTAQLRGGQKEDVGNQARLKQVAGEPALGVPANKKLPSVIVRGNTATVYLPPNG